MPDIDSSQVLCKPDPELPITDQYVSDGVANQEPQQRPSVTPSEDRRVRKRSAAPPAHLGYQDPAEALAHPSNRLIAQLNENWRVVDDPLQWILQRKKGSPREKNSGWRNRSFCTTREGLLRCIRECSGEIDADAFAKLRGMPDNHSDNGQRS